MIAIERKHTKKELACSVSLTVLCPSFSPIRKWLLNELLWDQYMDPLCFANQAEWTFLSMCGRSPSVCSLRSHLHCSAWCLSQQWFIKAWKTELHSEWDSAFIAPSYCKYATCGDGCPGNLQLAACLTATLCSTEDRKMDCGLDCFCSVLSVWGKIWWCLSAS